MRCPAGCYALTNRVGGGHGKLQVTVDGSEKVVVQISKPRPAETMGHQAGNATQLKVPPLQTHVATMSQMPVASLRQSAREGRKMYEGAAGRNIVEVGLLQLAAQSLANHS